MFNRKKKKKKQTNSGQPRYYELEQFRKSVNRKLWLTNGTLAVVAVLSLVLGLMALARPLPVVVIDSRGRPILFEDTTTPRRQIDDLRIEYFVEEFLSTYVGVDSSAVSEDLQKALSMMTPQFRQVVLSNDKELADRNKYQGQNLRSRMGNWKIRVGKYEPDATEGEIHVLASGQMNFEPRYGELEQGGEVNRWYLSQLVLRRVPVTKISIHGLQVAYCHTRVFDSKERLEAHLITRKEST